MSFLLESQYISEPLSSDIDFLTYQINKESPQYGAAYPFAFFIRDDKKEIIAGCNGSVIFGSIYTDQLWVHSDFRKKGLGSQLMKDVHDYGYKSGCSFATASTMNFQGAKAFYEKLGYVVDFERVGYTHNSSFLFMKKVL